MFPITSHNSIPFISTIDSLQHGIFLFFLSILQAMLICFNLVMIVQFIQLSILLNRSFSIDLGLLRSKTIVSMWNFISSHCPALPSFCFSSLSTLLSLASILVVEPKNLSLFRNSLRVKIIKTQTMEYMGYLHCLPFVTVVLGFKTQAWYMKVSFQLIFVFSQCF